MAFSAELFSARASEAEQFLNAHGFTRAHDTQKNSDGSLCAEYSRADQKILLVWDADKKWLRLVSQRSGGEEELIFRPLQGATNEQHQRALHDAIQMMREYFSPHHHHDDDENICGCAHHHA